VSYLSACAVVIHYEEALYQLVYVPLPLPQYTAQYTPVYSSCLEHACISKHTLNVVDGRPRQSPHLQYPRDPFTDATAPHLPTR